MEQMDQPVPKNGTCFKVMSYERVSKDNALTDSKTFDTQSLRIREKLDQKYGPNNYDIETVTDNGVSGGTGFRTIKGGTKARKSLTYMRGKLETGAYDCFIFYNISRFARNPQVYHEMVNEVLVPTNTELAIATLDLDLKSGAGKLAASFFADIAAAERDGIVTRNKDASRTRFEMGLVVGLPGYGWKLEKVEGGDPAGPGGAANANNPESARYLRPASRSRSRIFPVEEEVAVIFKMRDWYLKGWTSTSITRELIKTGVPSPSGRGQWTNAMVLKILDNPQHYGHICAKGKTIPGEHYERRLWDEDVAKELSDARARRTVFRTGAISRPQNLLYGTARCARCGGGLRVINYHSTHPSYACLAGVSNGRRICTHNTVPAVKLEKAAIDAIREVAARPELLSLAAQEAERIISSKGTSLATEKSRITAALKQIEQKRYKCAERLLDDDAPQDMLLRLDKELIAQASNLTKELIEIDEQLAHRDLHAARIKKMREMLKDFETVWHHINLDERREMVSLLVESLTIDRSGWDVTVQMKLVLLPAATIIIPAKPGGRGKKAGGLGVYGLSPRKLAMLHHLDNGLSAEQAAAEMGVHATTVRSWLCTIRKEAGMHDIRSICTLARPRINSKLHTLPLGKSSDPRSDGVQRKELSPKLREVWPLLAKGMPEQIVADRLGLTKSQVQGRRKMIYGLFGVKRMFEAAEKAAVLKYDLPTEEDRV